MKTIKILILEDDLGTLEKIFSTLSKVEEKLQLEISPVVISESPQVDLLINKNPDIKFDLILLDRDCKIGGSFHNLDIEKFGANKVIGISSVPPYNEELKARGVNRIVGKDYRDLNDFGKRLLIELTNLLSSLRKN